MLDQKILDQLKKISAESLIQILVDNTAPLDSDFLCLIITPNEPASVIDSYTLYDANGATTTDIHNIEGKGLYQGFIHTKYGSANITVSSGSVWCHGYFINQ